MAAAGFSPELRRLVVAAPATLDPPHLRAAMARWGPWAPVASVLLMVLHTAVPIPAELLTAANGALFGFWGGLVVSWTGALAGASVGFGLARWLGRTALLRVLPAKALEPVDHLIGRAGWEIALVLRLLPVISFNLVNFALGLTDLPWRTFLWTTAVGVLPVEIAVVAVGYGAGGAHRILPWALGALVLLTAAGLAVRRRVWRSSSGSEPPRKDP